MSKKVMDKCRKIKPKRNQNGSQNRWKIEVASRMRFWNVFGRSLGANTPQAPSGLVRISVAYGNVPAPGLRKGKTRSQEFLRIVFWTNAEEILQPRRHNGHRSTVSASDFGTYIRVPENECRKIDCMINTQHDVATESVSNLCKHVSATGRIRKERVYEKHICKHDARIPPG